jgi:transglutaminase-like putative cysteine protease
MEWFLFDEQTGFCNYYATAQVLMLRSLGIPARFVVGYAQGEYDPQTKTYTVRKKDSHAWPEVYFIDYGWMPFEPTVDQPALIRPLGIDRTEQDNLLPEREDITPDG